MAETATKTATPRSRTRKPATTAAKPAATTAAKPAPATADDKMRLQFSLEYMGDTKNYATFNLAKDVQGNATGCVGKFYAPLGTEEVKVLVVGAAVAE